MPTNTQCKVRTVALSSLTLDPANLRRHPVRNLDAIKASLKRFGQQKPIVVDANGVIIAGNGVFTAARELGWKEIACVESSLTGVERVVYAIADNQAPLLAEWDEPALLDVLETLGIEECETLGFSREDITAMRDEDLAHIEDEPAIAPAPVPVTQLGDIWHLGDHRIINGDSTKPETYAALMQGEKALLCATDPPYLVDYTGSRPNNTGKDWSDIYKEIDIPDANHFFLAMFGCVLEVLGEHAAIYCWHAHKRHAEITAVWKQLGIFDHQQIIWVKPSAVFGRVFYHFQHEPCMMGWREGSMPRHNGDHSQTSVWQLDWEGNNRVIGNEHPTQKPLEIFAIPMRKHTLIGDIVLEPFSGSGSQLIAAEKLRRRCRAIELQPVFVDVAIRRWQRETGREARLADGRTWREVAKARGVRLGPDDTPLDVQAPRVVEPKPKRGKHQPCPPDSPSSAAVAAAPASPTAPATTARNTKGKRGKAAGATPAQVPPSVGTEQSGEPSAAAS